MNRPDLEALFSDQAYRIQSPHWMIRETEFERTREFLEPYLADLHVFFMRRLNAMLLQQAFDAKEEQRLNELLAELIRVKKALAGIESDRV